MTIAAPISAARLSARLLKEEEFAASKAAWDSLRAQSTADPLFMCWDWQWRWWVHHAAALAARLKVLAIYRGDELVGLAPFYSRTVVLRRLLRIRRMELIGTTWRHPHAAFSDYLDIIARPDCRHAVLETIAQWLRADDSWDDLALCCTPRQGLADRLAARLAAFAYVREVDELSGWCAHLPPRFEEFTAGLSSDTRRKLFHHRRKLASPELRYASEGEIPAFLDVLWAFSSARWGAQSGIGFREFHLDIAACMARSGRLRLSQLCTRQGSLSVMYSVQTGRAIYYLQSGFDPSKAHGLSPGYLHFGYAIEAACGEGAERFDFLAGSGRKRDYKRDLLAERVPVASWHVVCKPVARVLYAGYEVLLKCRNSLHFS